MPPTPPTAPTPVIPTQRCHRCGYDRARLPAASLCPICGALPADATRTCAACSALLGLLPLEAPCPSCGAVPMVGDRPCIACGYSLRGLAASADCPECGTPIASSLRGNVLAFAGPGYLGALHTGVLLVELSAALSIITSFGVVVAAAFLGTPGIARPSQDPAIKLLGAMVTLAVSLVSILGWWRLSAPDPGLTGQDTSITSRKVLRAAVIGALLFALGQAAAALGMSVRGGPVGPQLNDPFVVFSVLCTIGGGAAWLVQFFAAMLHISWLARRMPDEQLFRSAQRFMWLGPVLYTVGALLFCLGPVVAFIMYILILDKTRRNLKYIRATPGPTLAVPAVALPPHPPMAPPPASPPQQLSDLTP